VEVWIVRHGERVDEVPGNTWIKCGKRNRLWFDPALTAGGHVHAEKVATAVCDRFAGFAGDRHRPGLERAPPFHAIYTSPLIRTVQTAEKFSVVPRPETPALLAMRRDCHLLFDSRLY
jgi:broad specificity phosphatase PhoE